MPQTGLMPPCLASAEKLEVLVDAFIPDETPDIFNHADFHRLHRQRFAGTGAYMQLRHPSGRIRGAFHALETEPGLFASPGRGSYGGFDIDEELNCTEITRFVNLAEEQLRGLGARRLEVVLPPFCYAPERGALVFNALAGLGYVVQRHELNQSISLQHARILAKGSGNNRTRLNKAVREGVTATRLIPAEYRSAYEVLAESRHKKNYTLSMSWADVTEMLEAFPKAVRFFGAWHGGKMVGAALCVVINPQVLYLYTWGEVAGIERLSPVTVIADMLCSHARAEGFRILDLGTSSLHGVVNPGLFAFKKTLGAMPSIKLFLGKTLAWRL
jgi:hypothetical protein